MLWLPELQPQDEAYGAECFCEVGVPVPGVVQMELLPLPTSAG